MRRNFVLVTVLAIMLVASISLAAKNGAVKSPLANADTRETAGWVNMNINAKGVLIVTMHLDVPGNPGAVQDMFLNIQVRNQFGNFSLMIQYPSFMTLNAAGKGTKQIKVQLTGLDILGVRPYTSGDAGDFETDPFFVK